MDMSAGAASLCSALLLVSLLLFVSAEQKTISADPGQNVTLTCRAPSNNTIIVEWSRADLGSEYVLLYQDGQFVPDNQHPSFKNRVDLQDRQMKDGDVSLTLKHVMMDDDGEYECQVLVGEPRSWETISISYLSVHPPGSGGLTTFGIIVISLGVLLAAGLAGYVGFKIYRKCKERQPSNREQINFRSVKSTNTQP